MSMDATDRLLELARADRVSIPPDFVTVLRASKPGSPLHDWVEGYLTSRSHTAKSVIHPDLQSVARLKSATGRIQDQTRSLRAQRQRLERHTGQNSGKATPASNQPIVDAQQARLINEAKTADLVTDLRTKSSMLIKETDAVARDVAQLLRNDDHSFESLNNTLTASRSWNEVDQLAGRVDELESTLHNIRVSALKDRLDRVYLGALVDFTHGTLPDPDVDARSLGQDIQSLYTEIEDVVTMLNAHDHINDLQRQLENIGQKQQHDSSENLSKVSRQ
jgi:hypothetical protein